jgi:hypothetical protein
MRDAIRRVLSTPPPRGAVVVVAVGVLVTIAAIALSKDAGGSGEDVAYVTQKPKPFGDSALVSLAGGGNTQIVDGFISYSDANESKLRVYRIEASLRANAGTGSKVTSILCGLKYPKGVSLGTSGGRAAAFPRPLEDTSDDAIKEATDVEYDTSDSDRAAVDLREDFFKYVIGGNPSVSWPGLTQDQNAWLWRYPKPVERTRVNFAVLAIARGGQSVAITCTPRFTGVNAGETTVDTSVTLPH